MDMIPEGYVIVSRHLDKPGVIGKIGTFLGENKINVAGFYLGREETKGYALGFVSLDSRVPEEVLEGIRQLPEVIEAKEIVL